MVRPSQRLTDSSCQTAHETFCVSRLPSKHKESKPFLKPRKRQPRLFSKLGNRVQKLKDARTEGEKEVEEYKQAKESEFKAFEASHAGTTSTVQAAIDQETQLKLEVITDSYNKARDSVVKKLLDRVVLVEPQLHRNLKRVQS
ncbi:hypothetical protein AX17_003576 [Amanita inopinata Kibby_2008]|nr:hypothetical protein AX17_003576 [Amanita inopinata Kibby_2008]